MLALNVGIKWPNNPVKGLGKYFSYTVVPANYGDTFYMPKPYAVGGRTLFQGVRFFIILISLTAVSFKHNSRFYRPCACEMTMYRLLTYIHTTYNTSSVCYSEYSCIKQSISNEIIRKLKNCLVWFDIFLSCRPFWHPGVTRSMFVIIVLKRDATTCYLRFGLQIIS